MDSVVSRFPTRFGAELRWRKDCQGANSPRSENDATIPRLNVKLNAYMAFLLKDRCSLSCPSCVCKPTPSPPCIRPQTSALACWPPSLRPSTASTSPRSIWSTTRRGRKCWMRCCRQAAATAAGYPSHGGLASRPARAHRRKSGRLQCRLVPRPSLVAQRRCSDLRHPGANPRVIRRAAPERPDY